MRKLVVLMPLFLACATSGTGSAMVVTPEGFTSNPAWTQEELERPSAVRNLRRTPEASFHLLRIRTDESPHLHERSDFVLFLLVGKLDLTLGTRSLTVEAGDVVEVPRGTPVGAKNLAESPSIAYLVYTPALDPSDRRQAAGDPPSESAWKWNLWMQ